MPPELLFREKQGAIDFDFKPAALGWHQYYLFDLGFEFLEQFCRQTGGTIGIVSDCAVSNRDIEQHANLQAGQGSSVPIISHPFGAFW